MMRFLADENCDRLIVETLRTAGHDVSYVVEGRRGQGDQQLFKDAFAQNRILLTADLDFGHLAEQEAQQAPAIILMRLSALNRDKRARRVADVVEQLTDAVPGHLLIIEPGQIRLRTLNKV
ncbi:MAG TPA: DUF5615 family PIN-like protein [Rhizomicrobium sp.]